MTHLFIEVNPRTEEKEPLYNLLKSITSFLETKQKLIEDVYEKRIRQIGNVDPKQPLKNVASAVLIPLVLDKNNELKVLLTLRTNRVSIFKNEVSFPGGKWEKKDQTFKDTALRESFEEIGLNEQNVDVVSSFLTLTTYRKKKLYKIHSYIGVVKESFYAKLNRKEVEDILLVPFTTFMNTFTRISVNGFVRQHHSFKIYGVTYVYLAIFCVLLFPKRDTLPFLSFLKTQKLYDSGSVLNVLGIVNNGILLSESKL